MLISGYTPTYWFDCFRMKDRLCVKNGFLVIAQVLEKDIIMGVFY